MINTVGHKPKLSWVDVKTLGTENKHKLATVIGTSASGSKGLKKDKNASSCSSLHSENGITKMKSILKVNSGVEYLKKSRIMYICMCVKKLKVCFV